MHTVVFGWFGVSAIWFAPLLVRLAKSVLPGGGGTRGPGTIRLWLGFVCVLATSCALMAAILPAAGGALGLALVEQATGALGRAGAVVAMLAVFVTSLPWLLGIRASEALRWADRAFGLGLNLGEASDKADSARPAAMPREDEARVTRTMQGPPRVGAPRIGVPNAHPGPRGASGRYTRPTPWQRPPTPSHPASASARAKGRGTGTARFGVGTSERTGVAAAASATVPIERVEPTLAVASASFGARAASDMQSNVPKVTPERDALRPASPGTAAGEPPARPRPPVTKPVPTRAGVRVPPAVPAGSATAPATPGPAVTRSPSPGMSAAARPQTVGIGRPVTSHVPPNAPQPSASPAPSVLETLRAIEANAAQWTTLAGVSLARRKTSALVMQSGTGTATLPSVDTDAAAGLGNQAAEDGVTNGVTPAGDVNVGNISPLEQASTPMQTEPATLEVATQTQAESVLVEAEQATPAQSTPVEVATETQAQPAPVEASQPMQTESEAAGEGDAPDADEANAPASEFAPAEVEQESEAQGQPVDVPTDAAPTHDDAASNAPVLLELVTHQAISEPLAKPTAELAPAPVFALPKFSVPVMATVVPASSVPAAPAIAATPVASPASEAAISHIMPVPVTDEPPALPSPATTPVATATTSAPAAAPSSVDADPDTDTDTDTDKDTSTTDAVAAPTVDARPRAVQGHAPTEFTFHAPFASAVELPTLDLLEQPSADAEPIPAERLTQTSQLIEQRLQEFKVPVTVVGASAGPVITRFEVEPALGVRGSQIVGLMKDLSRGLGLTSIRVVETIPGKTCMGLELPNAKRQTIRLSEILAADVYQRSASQLTIAMGKDITGNPVVTDLAKAPHMLVAGTTGSGKSVAINAMIVSLLYKAAPEDVRLIMIDPKMLELSVYEGIPHLLAPVVTDMKLAANALNWCVGEMEKRYRLMSAVGVRNLAGFNQKVRDFDAAGKKLTNPFSLTPEAPEPLSKLPLIVVVIDELADLMMVAGKKIEELIARLAQKARAAGIHLILATQRPSVDVITGLIKANIPTRVAFQVSSKIDSRTILDQMGAESLLGQGDMLFLPPGTGYPQRVHGAFVADEEVHRVVEYLKQFGEPQYEEGILDGPATEGAQTDLFGDTPDAEADPLYDEAVAFVVRTRRASISAVQRQLRIGYNRAARLVEQMEAAGLVSSMSVNGSREVLAPPGPEQ